MTHYWKDDSSQNHSKRSQGVNDHYPSTHAKEKVKWHFQRDCKRGKLTLQGKHKSYCDGTFNPHQQITRCVLLFPQYKHLGVLTQHPQTLCSDGWSYFHLTWGYVIQNQEDQHKCRLDLSDDSRSGPYALWHPAQGKDKVLEMPCDGSGGISHEPNSLTPSFA